MPPGVEGRGHDPVAGGDRQDRRQGRVELAVLVLARRTEGVGHGTIVTRALPSYNGGMEKDERTELEAAFRSACWAGAWRMLGAVTGVLIVAAVLFPAFYSSHGGPKLSARIFAGVIERVHRETGRWPTTFAEVSPRVTADDHVFHRASFVKLAERGDEADYAVAFDHSMQMFHLGGQQRVQKFGEVASGELQPRGISYAIH